MHKRPLSATIAIYAVLVVGAIIMTVPFLWMLSTSLKVPGEIFTFPPKWVPDPIVFENFPRAWNALPFDLAYINSLKIAVFVTVGTLLTCSMAGYAFAKISFTGSRIIFILILATMMIPNQVTLVPVYMIFSELNWIDTHWPLMIPPVLGNAFGVFLLRQFIAGIPNELEDAAEIDGCNRLQVYFKIILPNAKPALAALAIFTFMGTWNNFLGPLIYLHSEHLFTIPLLISSFQGLYTTDWTLLMAASTISLIPVIGVYLMAQKYFVEGITLSGLKG
ncbi:carbohydrate ABC transporter permease [Aureibacillus halotolerans]|uniref:Carbohydrate ABC transporter membrane protein 2 (CUT1 family) n=1 Tax=Aureibacillus halotolerans TaxID=1508390 RepID=A0A4R6TXY7_9BACI|nr:carbohydrate ABC transporter permease [Aureibacillus halotolerans]TDQ37662.1 carbohydrate ABC transporter membrane protein 2 (CUT1 family) [Aureibacillus halotolerans]